MSQNKPFPKGGVTVKHSTKKGGIALLPIFHKPLFGDSIYPCPNCQIIHTDSYGKPVKTVHLWLDGQGQAIISHGVLADLRKAGHFDPLPGLSPLLSIGNGVADPPPITLTGNRFEVDRENRGIRIWKEPVIV